MVGHSRQVYKGCMELIVARFADTIDSSSPHITLKVVPPQCATLIMCNTDDVQH